jgi:hypothetical protein
MVLAYQFLFFEDRWWRPRKNILSLSFAEQKLGIKKGDRPF